MIWWGYDGRWGRGEVLLVLILVNFIFLFIIIFFFFPLLLLVSLPPPLVMSKGDTTPPQMIWGGVVRQGVGQRKGRELENRCDEGFKNGKSPLSQFPIYFPFLLLLLVVGEKRKQKRKRKRKEKEKEYCHLSQDGFTCIFWFI